MVVVGCPWHCSIVPAIPPHIERMATLMSWLFRVLYSNACQLEIPEPSGGLECLHSWRSARCVCDAIRVNVCVGWLGQSQGLRGKKDSADYV